MITVVKSGTKPPYSPRHPANGRRNSCSGTRITHLPEDSVTPKKTDAIVKRPGVSRRPKAKTPKAARPADIAARAHQLFVERGATHGRDWEDWLRAERELQ